MLWPSPRLPLSQLATMFHQNGYWDWLTVVRNIAVEYVWTNVWIPDSPPRLAPRDSKNVYTLCVPVSIDLYYRIMGYVYARIHSSTGNTVRDQYFCGASASQFNPYQYIRINSSCHIATRVCAKRRSKYNE